MTITVFPLLAVFAFSGNGTPIEVGRTHTIESKVMGETRTIRVRVPEGYESGGRFPVLYLTDAGSHFMHTCGTVDFLANNDRMPEMIVVGIENTQRARDLTPTKPDKSRGHVGGADTFLAFFKQELFPYIEETYRTLPYRVFAGHSLGGLFAMHAFVNHTDTFNAYIAVSPSLWWDDQIMIGRAKTFMAQQTNLNKTLFMTLGDENPDMQNGFDAMIKALRKAKKKNLHFGHQQMKDEDHGSVVLRSHYFGLKHVFHDWRMTAEEYEKGLPAILAHYDRLSRRFAFKVLPPETMINQLGYRYLEQGLREKALAALAQNVALYPNSANVYDSYGEALEKAGKLEQSRENYEKAWRRGKAVNHPFTHLYKENMDRVAAAMKEGKP